jgi:hypothetical protein
MLKLLATLLPGVLVLPLLLTACGGDEHRTVVVNPQPGQTVVVPEGGRPRVCPSGTVC